MTGLGQCLAIAHKRGMENILVFYNEIFDLKRLANHGPGVNPVECRG